MPRPKTSTPRYSLAERNGRFYAQWWDGAAKKRISLGTADREEAKRALNQFIAGADSTPAPDQPVVADILTHYIVDRRPVVASIASIEYAADALREHLGDLEPLHLTRQVIRSYWDKRRKQGRRGATGGAHKSLSDGTIIREIVTLRAALRWAVAERWITAAPNIEAPTAPRPKERWLTRDEARRLLEAAETPHLHLFIQIALYTGARSAAILSLNWDQVDFGSGLIRFGAGVGNKGRATIPMVPVLRDALRAAAQIRTRDHVIEYRGESVTCIRHGFRDRAKAAGLTNVTPHTLRHTCATWMVMKGVPFEMVAKFLGNSVEMIERVYGHHSPDWLKRAADALSGVSDSDHISCASGPENSFSP